MILRKIINTMIGLAPDRLAAVIGEEMTQKAVCHQKTTVKHGTNFYLAAHTVIFSPGSSIWIKTFLTCGG